MARTEVRTVAESIRRQLASTHRHEVNTLGALLTADVGDNVVTLSYPLSAGLIAGSVISVGTETMRVISVDPGAQELTVIRAWAQTVAVSAHALGDEVWVNPRFTGTDIIEAMHDEIASWDPDLFRVADDTVTVVAERETYELPAEWADALGVVRVRRNWTLDTSTSWPEMSFRLQRGTTAWEGATTTGILIRFLEPVWDGRLHILVARPFDLSTFELTTDLETDVGLKVSMIDLLKIGARYRLIGEKEVGRSARDIQDEPRRSEEVPARAAADESNRLYVMYLRRKATEIAKQRRAYPLVRG
jgi:hypothetical protein